MKVVKCITVNREYFDVKIFSDSMACAKIKRMKYMRNINDNIRDLWYAIKESKMYESMVCL